MESSQTNEAAINRARSERVLKTAFLEIFDEEAERLLSRPLSPEEAAQMEQLFSKGQRRTLRIIQRGVRRANFRRSPVRSLMKMAAAFVMALCLGGATAFAAIPSFRTQLYNFWVHVRQEYTELNMRSETVESAPSLEAWRGAYHPSVIPEGMHLKEAHSDSQESFMVYENASGKFFTFSELSPVVETNVDTEGARIRHETVNGQAAMVAVKEESCSIIWRGSDRYFILFSNLDDETLLEVARGVTRGE